MILLRALLMVWLASSGFYTFQNQSPQNNRESPPHALPTSRNLRRVIVLGHGVADPTRDLMQSGFTSYFPSGFAIVGSVAESNLPSLLVMENVVRVLPDLRISYDEKARIENDNPRPQTDMFRVRELTGASKANRDLKLNGSGVTVAVVDTGVDFGNLDISAAIARDSDERPIAIDADEQGLVITNTTFTARIGSVGNQYAIDETPDILVTSDGVYLNLSKESRGTEVKYWNGTSAFAVRVTQNYKIGNDRLNFILSKSGIYHFGLLMEQDSFGGPGDNNLFYPVLVVDSKTAGVYDTVYVDFSSTYALWTHKTKPDYSFYDEKPHHLGDGSELLVSDINGDGLPDISAGLLGARVLDVWGIFTKQTSKYDPTLGFPTGNLLPGLDPEGNFLGIMFDYEPHGTFCAANITSRGTVPYDVYRNGTLYRLPGIAPNAAIIAAKALWLGDVLYTWMWVSGFDLDVKSGRWRYTGLHRAQIVSNSWGWSVWPALGSGVGYDLVSILENVLSLPRYLSTEYPGTLFVHAAGNGGPGYGTMTAGGFSSFALTVGASTSFHWVSSTRVERMGTSSDANDDVIPWSCRGPNALGQSKPDILNVGAFAFDAGPVNLGQGNGSRAYDIFGGTSEAAPITAGAAAIVAEGLQKVGRRYDPSLIKTILMNMAKDLGNDPFVQGSGRVDVYKAAQYVTETAQDLSQFRLYTDATYQNTMASLAQAWTTLDKALPNATSAKTHGFLEDSAWYAGTVQKGGSAYATFVVENPSNHPITVSTRSSTLHMIADYSYSGRSDPSLGNIPLYFNLTRIIGSIPSDTSMMIVRLDYSFESFYNATATPYGYPSNLLYLYAYDWTDINHNGKVEWNETALVNYGYNWGNNQEIRISNPHQKMIHEKVIGVWEATPRYMRSSGITTANKTYLYKPVDFTLRVFCFKEAPWNWLYSSPRLLTVQPKSSRRFVAAIYVPAQASPGVYSGFLVAESKGQQITHVPVSITVPLQISILNEPERISTSTAFPRILYDNSLVHGATDWRWRYESGDWRILPIEVSVPQSVGTNVAVVRLEWVNSKTSIDVYAIDPSGNITATTTPPIQWLNGIPNNWVPDTGVFYRSQNSGPNATVLAIPINKSGRYTILLHTTLFDGRVAEERFDGTLEVTQLKVRPLELRVLDYVPYVIWFISGAALTLVLVTLRSKRRLRQKHQTDFHP